VELHQFEPAVTVRGLQHRDVHADALQSHHAVDPIALDHDAHVVQALDRHVPFLSQR
jgi:hypothetical protein